MLTNRFHRIWMSAAKFALEHNDTDTIEALLNYWPAVACKELVHLHNDLNYAYQNYLKIKMRLPK